MLPKRNIPIETVLMSMRYTQAQMTNPSDREEMLRIISMLEKAQEAHAEEMAAIFRGEPLDDDFDDTEDDDFED